VTITRLHFDMSTTSISTPVFGNFMVWIVNVVIVLMRLRMLGMAMSHASRFFVVVIGRELDAASSDVFPADRADQYEREQHEERDA